MTRRLTDILAALGDDSSSIPYQVLANFSDLNVRELEQLQLAWPGYTPARRLEFVRALVELAEDNIEYDYRRIFRWTLADADAEIRRYSVEGLWEDEDPQLIPRFLHMFQGDEDADVRAAAATALGQFVFLAETGIIELESVDRVVEAFFAAIHNQAEYVMVRRRALEGVAASSVPGVARLIEDALFANEPDMRPGVLFAMGRSADTRWIPLLIPELRSEEPDLRLEAVRSLGELEARGAVRAIVQMMAQETDLEVILAAVTALGQIGGDDARRALQAALEWDNEAIVVAAETALEELWFSEGSTYELIDEVLGRDEADLEDDDFSSWDDDSYERDPLDEEIRRLLDERSQWD